MTIRGTRKHIMNIPSLEEMLKAGAHFGHKSSRWHPKMEPYIYGIRHGVHVIDLEKTQQALEHVLKAVYDMAKEGKSILFVTTKPQAIDIVKQAALRCGTPFLVDRWIGGLLTNFSEIRKLVKKYVTLKEEQANGLLERYTKKEQLTIAKDLEKMDGSLAGLTSLEKMPDAIFIPSMQREKTAVVEANKMGVDIIAVCDTNANPDKAEYVIPANDDAIHSIEMITNLVADAIQKGKAEYEKNKAIGQK